MSVLQPHVDTFRNLWNAELVDTCTVDRPDFDTPSFDDVNGQTTYPTSQVYAGSCLWIRKSPTQRSYGEDQVQIDNGVLVLPHDAAILQEHDIATVASTADPALGAVTVMRTMGHSSYLTVRRYECEVPNVP